MSKLIVETNRVGDIPVLTVAQEGVAARPIVFAMHGFGGRKEHLLGLGTHLARRGLFVVAFDTAHHGERADGKLETFDDPAACVYPAASGLDRYVFMHELVVQTGQDVAALLDHYLHDRRADVSRCGVTGLSMGGFAAHYLAATQGSIRAAAPIIGMPAFAERWEDSLLEAWTYVEWREQLERSQPAIAEHTAFIRSIDPFDKLMEYAPRPLFMLCGDQDTDQPKVYSVRLLRALLPAYAGQPDRLRLKIYDGVRHELTEPMIEDVAGWLALQLT